MKAKNTTKMIPHFKLTLEHIIIMTGAADY